MADIMNMSREKLVSVLTIALEQAEFKFMQSATEQWLETYPGDLRIQLFQAVREQCLGEIETAKSQLKRLISVDPSFLEGYLAIADIYPEDENIWGYLFVLTGQEFADHKVPAWAKASRKVLSGYQNGDHQTTEKLLPSLLKHSGRNALVDMIHLLVVFQTQPTESVKTLASLYYGRWPACSQIKLILADACMKTEEGIKALKLLMECAAEDNVGQTAEWIWPAGNPYQSIWPVVLPLEDFIQIPASISSVFGWNLLPQGEVMNASAQRKSFKPKQVSKEATEVKKIFERLAKNLGGKTERPVDGRYPIYVILSSKGKLTAKYGSDSANVIIAQTQRIVEVVQAKREWGAMLFLPDDAAVMESIGLPVIQEIDPWTLKLALQDLDRLLGEKGAMIGAVLIVGGHEVVPFHLLPNPTDDVDDIVYSDNPYGCIDANYFVPDWPVGRLPDEKGKDTGLLMQQLRTILKTHQEIQKKQKATAGTMAVPFEMLLSFFQQLFKMNRNAQVGQTVGYIASVWRRAAIGAYRPIGASNLVAVSPPITAETVDTVALLDAELAYYNLHGIIDGGEWFGQKSFTDVWEGSEFPIALSPADIAQKGRHQQIIVSEACYGGYVINKTIEDSLALKFMSLEAKGFIGSTAIAYGSIQPPLIGADLLANKFWSALIDGKSVGESFLQAKHELAEEMNKRQKYLDAEDQKTLLSFVLYGDPLARYQTDDNQSDQKAIQRVDHSDALYLLTEKDNEIVAESEFTAHTIAEIKSALESYLPGMEFSEYHVQQQFLLEEESIMAKLSANPPERLTREANGNYIVSFRQKFNQYREAHQFFTKVTVDKTGKMLKISMSR